MKARGRPPGKVSAVPAVLARAAQKRLQTTGVKDIKVRELAADAHTSAAMINYYYGGKTGLFGSILEEALTALARRLCKMAREGSDAETVIYDILVLIDEHIAATGSHVNMFGREEVVLKDHYRDRCASRVYTEVLSALEQLYADRPDPRGRAAAAANAIISVTAMPFYQGELYASTFKDDPRGESRDRLRRQLANILA